MTKHIADFELYDGANLDFVANKCSKCGYALRLNTEITDSLCKSCATKKRTEEYLAQYNIPILLSDADIEEKIISLEYPTRLPNHEHWAFIRKESP